MKISRLRCIILWHYLLGESNYNTVKNLQLTHSIQNDCSKIRNAKVEVVLGMSLNQYLINPKNAKTAPK